MVTIDDVKNVLKAKNIDPNNLFCNVCQKNGFHANDAIGGMPQFNFENLEQVSNTNYLAHIVLNCNNCGNAYFLNTHVLGLT